MLVRREAVDPRYILLKHSHDDRCLPAMAVKGPSLFPLRLSFPGERFRSGSHGAISTSRSRPPGPIYYQDTCF